MHFVTFILATSVCASSFLTERSLVKDCGIVFGKAAQVQTRLTPMPTPLLSPPSQPAATLQKQSALSVYTIALNVGLRMMQIFQPHRSVKPRCCPRLCRRSVTNSACQTTPRCRRPASHGSSSRPPCSAWWVVPRMFEQSHATSSCHLPERWHLTCFEHAGRRHVDLPLRIRLPHPVPVRRKGAHSDWCGCAVLSQPCTQLPAIIDWMYHSRLEGNSHDIVLRQVARYISVGCMVVYIPALFGMLFVAGVVRDLRY